MPYQLVIIKLYRVAYKNPDGQDDEEDRDRYGRAWSSLTSAKDGDIWPDMEQFETREEAQEHLERLRDLETYYKVKKRLEYESQNRLID